jgi:hypothetical protein
MLLQLPVILYQVPSHIRNPACYDMLPSTTVNKKKGEESL